ncbi:MAG: glycosyltransferase [Synechocystis sp.]
MPRLSLCMIVHNEAALLPACLASVAALVDEMVIADTGSTDNTVEIAMQAGAKVIPIEWQEDFAAARNQALAQVTGDWVLVLDADETLNERIIPTLKTAIANEQALVVNLMRHELGSRQSPYSLVSLLFRHHPQLTFTRPYHESIDDSVLTLLETEPDWQVLNLAGVAIHHKGYTPELLQQRQKSQRAKALLEKAHHQAPHDPYVCNKLGALYLSMGDDKEGLKLLKQGLKSNTASSPIRFELHYHLANAFREQKKWELARKHYQKALNEEMLLPLKLGALLNYGGMLMALGSFSEALQIFETAARIDPSQAISFFNLGMIYKAQGRLMEALKAYQQAITLQPDYAEAHQNLGVTAFKAGLLAESLAAFKTAIALYDQRHSPEAEKLRQTLQELGMIEPTD